MNLVTSLKQIPLLAELNHSQLKALSQICKLVEISKDEPLFQQNQDAKGFYLILQGKIKVFKLSLEGKEQILHIFGPGEPVGEVPVFEGKNYPANAEAHEQSQVIFMPRAELKDLFANNPGLAMKMLAVLAKRLRIFTSKIEELTLKELPGRLATYFLQIQEAAQETKNIELDVSKGTLAKILGTSQESISRALKRMSEAKIIRVEKRKVSILNKDKLEALAHGQTSL